MTTPSIGSSISNDIVDASGDSTCQVRAALFSLPFNPGDLIILVLAAAYVTGEDNTIGDPYNWASATPGANWTPLAIVENDRGTGRTDTLNVWYRFAEDGDGGGAVNIAGVAMAEIELGQGFHDFTTSNTGCNPMTMLAVYTPVDSSPFAADVVTDFNVGGLTYTSPAVDVTRTGAVVIPILYDEATHSGDTSIPFANANGYTRRISRHENITGALALADQHVGTGLSNPMPVWNAGIVGIHCAVTLALTADPIPSGWRIDSYRGFDRRGAW